MALGTAIVGGLIAGAGALGGAAMSAGAAKGAAKTQAEATQASIAEQRAAREQLVKLLQPYTSAGLPALQAQMNLLGIAPQQTNWAAFAQSNPELMAAYNAQGGGGGQTINVMGQQITIPGGPKMPLEQFAQQWHQSKGGDLSRFQTGGAQGQQQAINQFEQSPMFQSLARQGEEAILQNASATGGLRGGNVQGALAQFRPALLNQQLQQQFQNLSGISALGQASAAGVGAGVQGAANNIGNLQMANAGNQANAGLVGANAYGQAFGQIGGLAGQIFGGMGGPSAGTVAALTPSAFNTIAANPSIF